MVLTAISHSCPKPSDKGDLRSSLSPLFPFHLFQLAHTPLRLIHCFLPTGSVLSGYMTQLPQLTPELIILERCYISFAHLPVLENSVYWACKITYTQAWRKLVLRRPISVIKRLPAWPQLEVNVSSKPITYSVYTQWV